jgi:glycerol-3-phosphate acyltransferase PlsY
VTSYAAAAVIGYLLGSIPVAVLVGRRHGVDPRTAGDRNPGYWNMKELVGSRAALPVFAGDVLKGLAAGLAGVALGGGPVVYVAVAAAMLGHAWPVFARFAGGRSILTFAGGLAAISPLGFAICAGLCVVVSVVTRFEYGARVGVFAAPVVQQAVQGWRAAVLTFLLMAIIGLRFGLAARRRT